MENALTSLKMVGYFIPLMTRATSMEIRKDFFKKKGKMRNAIFLPMLISLFTYLGCIIKTNQEARDLSA